MIKNIYLVSVIISIFFFTYAIYKVVGKIKNKYPKEYKFIQLYSKRNIVNSVFNLTISFLKLFLISAIPIANVFIAWNATSEEVIETTTYKNEKTIKQKFDKLMVEPGVKEKWEIIKEVL